MLEYFIDILIAAEDFILWRLYFIVFFLILEFTKSITVTLEIILAILVQFVVPGDIYRRELELCGRGFSQSSWTHVSEFFNKKYQVNIIIID